MNSTDLLTSEVKEELIEFTQSLVRIKSLSGHEGEIVKFIEENMIALGYDEVTIDSMGNLLGRIGNGEKAIMFDSHVDTVEVKDEEQWDIPPFSHDTHPYRSKKEINNECQQTDHWNGHESKTFNFMDICIV